MWYTLNMHTVWNDRVKLIDNLSFYNFDNKISNSTSILIMELWDTSQKSFFPSYRACYPLTNNFPICVLLSSAHRCLANNQNQGTTEESISAYHQQDIKILLDFHMKMIICIRTTFYNGRTINSVREHHDGMLVYYNSVILVFRILGH